MDIFRPDEKYHPHHLPLLVIFCASEAELAAQAPGAAYGSDTDRFPNAQALLAMMTATDKALRWTAKKTDYCVMHCTQNNVQRIRTLYPDIHFNDIAASWLHDTDPDPSGP